MTTTDVTVPLGEDFPEIRDGVRRICADFPDAYWCVGACGSGARLRCAAESVPWLATVLAVWTHAHNPESGELG